MWMAALSGRAAEPPQSSPAHSFKTHTYRTPQVSVYPLDHPKGQAAATATHTTEAKADVGSRKERRRTIYKPRGGGAQQQEPAVTVAVVAASTQP